MKKRIHRRAVPAIPRDLSDALHPVLARLYAARHIQSLEELESGLARLASADRLLGMTQAVAVLATALQEKQRILVVGDFDADGATSTTLVVHALRAFGAHHVDFLVPDRFRLGYGLTPEIVSDAAEYQPDLLITVDNGISSIAGVEAARARGWRVVITDHHLPGAELPAADAVVNPNQPGCPFPSKNLAGVGVAFYLMMGLRASLRNRGWFSAQGIAEPNLARYLGLVALGTIADVVPLDHNNRILAAQGLSRLRAGYCSAGFQALIELAGRKQSRLVASDLGFAIAPRLNAAGRLHDMALGVRCLLCDDPAEGARLASELDRLNTERRSIETVMKEEAEALLRQMRLAADLPMGLCLYQSGWHEGLLGIIASRLKDRWHRPVIVLTDTGDEGHIKGSARSVSGIHIRDVLDAVATRAPGLLLRFGGHAMAAGLALRRNDFERFAAIFDEEVRAKQDTEGLQGVIQTDGELDAEHMTLEVAEQLRFAGPWGQGFPEPLFDGMFEVLHRRIVGERHLKLTLRPRAGREMVEAIAFNAPREWCEATRTIRLAYRLEVNEYRGERTLQLQVSYLESTS